MGVTSEDPAGVEFLCTARIKAMSSNTTLQVHEVQRGNPVLKYIRNVKWEYSQDIVPDYVMSSTCALFVSVKFHFRHPTVVIKVPFLCFFEFF